MIYDLIYSHADKMYIAVPRDKCDRIHGDLARFDSGAPSGYYACTGIPTAEITAVLARHKNKYGQPLYAPPEESK